MLPVGQRGFSLIELMVSVAIIGVLASVGTQNYDQFMAKTRITRAANELAGLKTSVESLGALYGFYPSTNIAWMGALPVATEYQTNCTSFGSGSENARGLTEMCQVMSTFDAAVAGLPRVHPLCGEPRNYLYISNGQDYQLLGYCFDRSELSSLAKTNTRCAGGACWAIALGSPNGLENW